MQGTLRAGSTNLLDAALAYRERGFSVLPTRGKKPAVPWTPYQHTLPTEADLRRSFARPGVNGLAVVTGPVSGGLVCRDFDFQDSYDHWATTHRDLAHQLPTVETARGFHVYFRGPNAFAKLGDGEYRGDSRHYTMLPPSVHPTGALYRWVYPMGSGLPPFLDPFEVGLCPGPVVCHTENTGGNGGVSVFSALSVSSVWHDPNSTVQDAILPSLPTGPGQRHGALFTLARRLKALPHLADASPAALRGVVRQWHELALPVIRTKPFEESWIDFMDGWERVKYPAGAGPLDVLWSKALAEPLPTEALGYEQEPVRQLVALCHQLQRHAGQGTFFLACRTAGELLHVHYKTAWRWLQLLEIDRVLHRISTGTLASHRANEWRLCEGFGVIEMGLVPIRRTTGGDLPWGQHHRAPAPP
jgi:hypothetical protein